MEILTPEDLYRTHRTYLIRVASRFLRNPEDNEDCVQDAMVSIVKHWESRNPETTLSWASTIVANQARDIIRRRTVRCNPQLHIEISELRPEPVTPSFESAVLARLTIAGAIERLPGKLQAAMKLWLAGIHARDHISTLKVQQCRGRAMLRRHLSR